MARLLLFLICFITIACDTIDNRLHIKNLSKETIICYITADDNFPFSMNIRSKPYYLRNLPDLKPYYHEDFIEPGETKTEQLINDEWPDYIKNADKQKLRVWF
ncbi:MAG: hypothetical protein IPI93_03625 [Sphingobacteriaceae bacterium]|nr:hypothetical protein [Sphingobacteriaceae bacterium]